MRFISLTDRLAAPLPLLALLASPSPGAN